MASSDDYQPIEPGRCNPELSGWYVTREAAERIAIEQVIKDTDCQLAILDAQQKQLEAEERLKSAKAEADHNRWWASWGLPIGIVSGLVGVIAVGMAVGFSKR